MTIDRNHNILWLATARIFFVFFSEILDFLRLADLKNFDNSNPFMGLRVIHEIAENGSDRRAREVNEFSSRFR